MLDYCILLQYKMVRGRKKDKVSIHYNASLLISAAFSLLQPGQRQQSISLTFTNTFEKITQNDLNKLLTNTLGNLYGSPTCPCTTSGCISLHRVTGNASVSRRLQVPLDFHEAVDGFLWISALRSLCNRQIKLTQRTYMGENSPTYSIYVGGT